MKMIRLLSLLLVAGLLLTGCQKPAVKSRYTVGKDILPEDVKEFYYTYENINYNAFYQRYRFYTEGGKYWFYHETRQRQDDYGPATEEDVTAKGTVELTEAQWAEFFAYLKDGTVVKRHVSAESGDSGPWLYLYWTGDGDEYQEFSFDAGSTARAFEAFCEALAR